MSFLPTRSTWSQLLMQATPPFEGHMAREPNAVTGTISSTRGLLNESSCSISRVGERIDAKTIDLRLDIEASDGKRIRREVH